MRFNNHSELVGRHSFLSPSSYHWVNYTDEHLEERFLKAMTAQRGTELHDLAARLIKMGIKLPKTPTTMNLYVNDAIGYGLSPEVTLFYSRNCFGTADALGFTRNKLRVHDLKNGVSATKITQLEVYAALFCLEYRMKPFDIDIEMRIYQNNEALVYETDKGAIVHIMDRIITFDKAIEAMRMEAMS